MKILFVSEYYPPYIKGGAEISTSLLAEWLSKDHSVWVACCGFAKEKWIEKGIEVYPIIRLANTGKKRFFSSIGYALGIIVRPILSALALLRLVYRLKPEIVQIVPSSYQFIPAILAIRFLYRVPVVIDCRDFSLVCPYFLGNENFNEIIKKTHGFNCLKNVYKPRTKALSLLAYPFAFYEALVFNIYKYSLRFAANHFKGVHLVSVTKFVQDQLVLNGFRLKSIDVIRNIATLIKIDGKSNLSKSPNFIFAGRIENSKGIWDVVGAVEILKSRGYSFTVEIAGNGVTFDQLKSYIEKNKLTPIKLLGHMKHDQINELYSESIAILAPVRAPEASGRFVLESVAIGKPLISTRNGGIEEGVDEGETGFLVTIGDINQLANVMEKFILHPELAEQMLPAITQKRHLYDAEVIGKMRVDIYSAFINDFS